MWLSVDPLAEMTGDAYGYCFQNPINLIDPTGMSPEDDYGLSKNGKITLLRKTEDKTDKLIVLDNDEKETEKSTEVEKGVLDKIETNYTKDSNLSGMYRETQILDVSNISDTKSKELFEFIADNTISEFSYSIFSNSKKYISTTHLPNVELSMSQLFKRNNYSLLYHAHSHPKSIGPINPSPGDIGAAAVLFGKKNISAPLETYQNGNYKRYDHTSSSTELDDVTIEAPRRKKKN